MLKALSARRLATRIRAPLAPEQPTV
jgi:hypothetical protein